MRQPFHRHAQDAERKPVAQAVEPCGRGVSARRGIGDEADLMSARNLQFREIDDVTEQAAQGRAQDMHDPQGAWLRLGRAHPDTRAGSLTASHGKDTATHATQKM